MRFEATSLRDKRDDKRKEEKRPIGVGEIREFSDYAKKRRMTHQMLKGVFEFRTLFHNSVSISIYGFFFGKWKVVLHLCTEARSIA